MIFSSLCLGGSHPLGTETTKLTCLQSVSFLGVEHPGKKRHRQCALTLEDRPGHSFRETVALPGWRLPHTSLPHATHVDCLNCVR